jgi:hypothetical protein
MAITPSITETQVFTALRAFILTIVDCEVVRALNNRVPMPKGDFIALSPPSIMPLSTNVTAFNGTSNVIKRSSQFLVQVDCYGAGACDRATAISMLLRDQYGCEQFAASGFDIQPLYASDAHQIPLVDGEAQYEERWTFEAVMQFNPALTIAQQSAITLSTDVIGVVRTYPP